MTQPDELFPEAAANAGSLSAFAAKTQEDWEAEQRQAEMNRWGILGILFEIFPIDDIIALIIKALTGGSSGTPPAGTPSGASGLIKIFQDLLGMLFGGNPPPLGTGGGTQQPPVDPGDTTGGIITGNNDLKPYLREIVMELAGWGAGTSENKVNPHQLNALSSGTGRNVLPDPDFLNASRVAGQGQWIWDWPGQGGGTWGGQGCVRTIRPGTITIYYVLGTRAILPTMSALPDPKTGFIGKSTDYIYTEEMFKAKAWPPTNGGNLINWEQFDFVLVPYPAAMFPMGGGVAEGTKTLINLIKARPGMFMMIGESQGGAICSNVYDEIRYGTLQNRNTDFLFGVGIGNLRRQKGRSFPGGPVYCPEGWGAFEPTLSATEDRWWEWSLPAGTYPAFNKSNGATWAMGDVVSCVGNQTPVDKGVRTVISATMKAANLNLLAGLGIVWNFLTSPGGQALQKAIAPAEAHATSVFVVQPFLAQGDPRTMWQIIYDKIESFGHLADPPENGVPHKLVADTPVVVKPLQALYGECKVEWVNMPNAVGAEIILGVDVWDSDGNYIPGDVPGQPTVVAPGTDAVISNPTPGSDWVEMSATFVMPKEGDPHTACLAVYVSGEAMTTATVWVDKAEFEQRKLVDAALFENLEEMEDKFLPEQVAGSLGMEDVASMIQTMIDKGVSAHKGEQVTGQQFADWFAAQAQTAVNAAQALALAESLNEQANPGTVVVPVSQSWNTPGTYTFILPSWITTGDVVDGVCLGAGGGGQYAGLNRQGGEPGEWGWEDPLVYGTDIPGGTTQLKIVVGEGPPRATGSAGKPGGNGEPSSIRLMNDTILVEGAAGLGGAVTGNTNPGSKGLSPGDFSYPPTGELFFGGPQVDASQNGSSPGGAGGGSKSAFNLPGAGGHGAVFITVRRP